MKLLKYYFNKIAAVDLVVIIFLLLLTILNLSFTQKVQNWVLHIFINFAIIIFIFISAVKMELPNGKIWKQLHLWYLVPFVFIVFKELYGMIDPIREKIYDDILILADRFIFRTDPTAALYSIVNPFLTELLQIIYGTFFFLPVILGIDLIRQNKKNELDYSAFIIVYGFCLSFIGYFLVPAIGPRFTLHNFEMNNIEMPGIFITDFLREIVNSGESIPSGTVNPALLVQRDAFPSGHTQMTLLVMFLSVKFKSRLKLFFIINGSLLIFATVYLRYHYVADLIGGLIFMIFTLWSGKYIYKWWSEFTSNNFF
jgi:membrane-associated phospholipid phosphatase